MQALDVAQRMDEAVEAMDTAAAMRLLATARSGLKKAPPSESARPTAHLDGVNGSGLQVDRTRDGADREVRSQAAMLDTEGGDRRPLRIELKTEEGMTCEWERREQAAQVSRGVEALDSERFRTGKGNGGLDSDGRAGRSDVGTIGMRQAGAYPPFSIEDRTALLRLQSEAVEQVGLPSRSGDGVTVQQTACREGLDASAASGFLEFDTNRLGHAQLEGSHRKEAPGQACGFDEALQVRPKVDQAAGVQTDRHLTRGVEESVGNHSARQVMLAREEVRISNQAESSLCLVAHHPQPIVPNPNDDLKTVQDARVTQPPLFVARFAAGWVYSVVATVGVSILEKEKRYSEAVTVLRQLLGGNHSRGRRGQWWGRLSINLDHLGRSATCPWRLDCKVFVVIFQRKSESQLGIIDENLLNARLYVGISHA